MGAELKITYRVHRHVNGGNFWKESRGVAFCATEMEREGGGCRLYARGGERGRREREALITESTGRRLSLKSGVVREQNNVSVIENA